MRLARLTACWKLKAGLGPAQPVGPRNWTKASLPGCHRLEGSWDFSDPRLQLSLRKMQKTGASPQPLPHPSSAAGRGRGAGFGGRCFDKGGAPMGKPDAASGPKKNPLRALAASRARSWRLRCMDCHCVTPPLQEQVSAVAWWLMVLLSL